MSVYFGNDTVNDLYVGLTPVTKGYVGTQLFYNGENTIIDTAYEKYILNTQYSTLYNTDEKPIKSAILKGNTKYRDIDTGDILDTFDETENLELVSVKMPVLKTTGKNLLYAEWEIDKRLMSNGSLGDYIGTNTSNYINVSNLDVITFSGFSKGSHCLYDKDKNNIGGRVMSSNMTVDVSSADYIRVTISNTKDYSNPQMEVGSVATTYEPYKSNILKVNEDVTLRSNGDICDELNLLTGQLTQRIGEDGVVLSQEVIKTVDLSVVDQDGNNTELKTFDDITHVTLSSEGLIPEAELEVATKNKEVLNTLSLEMDDISTTQNALKETSNTQSENVDATMVATTEIYEQLL